MARPIFAIILALIALWPLRARAEHYPLNALEAGAIITTCMYAQGDIPAGEDIELQGTIQETTLVWQARPFMVLHRRDLDSAHPPLVFEVIGPNNSDYRRKIVSDAVDCFNTVMSPQAP